MSGSMLRELPIESCPCTKDCVCPSHRSGCRHGFCFCTKSGLLARNADDCDFGNHGNFGNHNITNDQLMMCAIRCWCGCKPHETCGSDGICRCGDDEVVRAIVNGSEHLVGQNRHCAKSQSVNGTNHHLMGQNEHHMDESASITPLVLLLAPLMALLLTSFLMLIIWRRRKLLAQTRIKNDENIHLVTINNEQLQKQALMDRGCPILRQNDITLQENIGKGHFSRVYKGHIKGKNQLVAVKIAFESENCCNCIIKDVLLEAQVGMKVRHRHLLQCLGVAINHDNTKVPWLIFEFVPKGDLATILRRQDEKSEFSLQELWSFAKQVSLGMHYLSSHSITHRDLAARNCLLGKNLQVKICDLGLAREVGNCEYYRVSQHKHLPVRWMAPEAIELGKFSMFSDIWAFGVFIFELATKASTPYANLSNQEVVKLIPLGKHRLQLPETCPKFARNLLENCTAMRAENRPDFQQVLLILAKAEVDLARMRCNALYDLLPASEERNEPKVAEKAIVED